MLYRPEIDGLRAIAVAGVVIFHAGFSIGGTPILGNGYLGVDVFFVISGYLITRLILKDLAAGEFSLGRFYMRRARRILPAQYSIIAASLLAGTAILPPDALMELGRSALAASVFVANVYFWRTTDYFSEAGELIPLLHLWSLSVEEQFYLVYPLVLGTLGLGLYRWRSALLALALLISLVAAVAMLGRSEGAVFHLVFFRAWELLAGALIGLRHTARGEPKSGVGFIPLVGIGLIIAAFSFPSGLGKAAYLGNVAAVAGAMLFIGWSGQSHGAGRWLSVRPMVGLGLVSYSLYLCHQPVFAFARHLSINELTIWQRVGLLALSLMFAVLMWRFIETPFRNVRTVSQRFFIGSVGAVTVGIVAAAVTVVLTLGLPQRYSPGELRFLSASAERGTLVLNGQDCVTKSVEQPCIIGSPGGRPTWALLGDSHAETLADSLSALLEKNRITGEVLTYPACPFVLGVEPVHSGETCDAFTAAVLEKLLADGIETVVINDRLTAYMIGTRFDNGEGGVEPGEPFPVQPVGRPLDDEARAEAVAARFKHTMTALLEAGIRVIYIAPVPEVGWHAPRIAARLSAYGGLPLTTSLPVYLERHAIALNLLKGFEGREGFLAIYPHEVFCQDSTGRCVTHSDDRLFYTDTDHLSREGAALLIDHLGERLHDEGIIEAIGTVNSQ